MNATGKEKHRELPYGVVKTLGFEERVVKIGK